MAGGFISYEGACHCGDVRFEATAPPTLRACQCSFCRRHGAKTTSDRASALIVTGQVRHYGFASRTADFLLCPECGAFIAAAMNADGRQFGVVNVVGAQIEGLWDQPAEAMAFGEQSPTENGARRLSNWTPMRFEARP